MKTLAWTRGALGASVAAGALALCLAPGAARACGGLFCDRPPANPFDPLPVVQSGENIVFAVGTDPITGIDTVEAHIQIFYQGPAAQFSWVVPVDALPTVGVGTDQIFTVAAAATRPSYSVTWVAEGTCKVDTPRPGEAADASAGGTGTGGSGGATGTVNGGVDVAFRGAVGPYDTAVIQSGSAAALLKWLADNGYFVGDDAAAIIAQYVAEQKYFVAIRLLNGQAVTAIQPVVLRFASAIPCVPLRLTAIAALADLSINLWVLGDSRAVPKNYFEIKLNDARIDWLQGGRNYSELVKAAADEAGGNAFIAEYAGTARIMDRTLWPNGRIDLLALRAALTPPAYLQQVVAQGLTQFGPMLDILRTYIPEPQRLVDMGISEAQFYNQNAVYWAQFQADFAPFSPGPITDKVASAIVDPLKNAQALFDAHPYLTRLATFISPEEMTRDPLFIFNPDLPSLSNTHDATAHVMCGNQAFRWCDAPIRLDLPAGQQVWFSRPVAANGYCPSGVDRGDLDQMPALDVAYQRAEAGEGNHVADNGSLITRSLATHNGPFTTVMGRITAAWTLAGGTGGGSSGCSCSSAGGGLPLGLGAAAALLAVLGVWRRRRG